MTAETDIAAIDDGGANTAAEVRTAFTSVLDRADGAGLKPPDSPNGSDIEFIESANGTNPTTLGLTWANQGNATASIQNGRLLMNNGGDNGAKVLYMATPGAGNFSVATRVEFVGNFNYPAMQISFFWGTPGSHTDHESAGIYGVGTGSTRLNWTDLGNDYTPDVDRVAQTWPMGFPTVAYLLVEWDGTDLVYSVSPTGRINTFKTIYTATLGLGRPDNVGFSINANSTNSFTGEFAFLRFGWTASDYDPS